MPAFVMKMPPQVTSLPDVVRQQVATFPVAVRQSRRKASLLGHRTYFHSQRFIAHKTWNAFFMVMTTIIPDDFYDWEDADVAEFLGEDIYEVGFYDI